MTAFVKDLGFVRKNRPKYLKRSKKIDQNRVGIHKDLYESYERLVEQNLIENLNDDIYLTWINDRDCCKSISALLKVAAISTKLDSDDVPDEVLDVMMYEAICNIRAGQRDFGKKGGIENDWDNHPMMRMAVGWCQDNGMAL